MLKTKFIPSFLDSGSVTIRLSPSELANVLVRSDDKYISKLVDELEKMKYYRDTTATIELLKR